MKLRLLLQARSGTSSAEIPYCGYKERQPAGSIGLCDGSYCRRADSAAAVGSGQQIANMAWRSNDNLGRSIAFTEMFDYESVTKCKDHSSLQFSRRRSNRFGENRLTDACKAVFQKQAAPKSHAFLFCHEPLPPSTRCGELRGGLSSRVPATATQFRWIIQRKCCALRSGRL